MVVSSIISRVTDTEIEDKTLSSQAEGRRFSNIPTAAMVSSGLEHAWREKAGDQSEELIHVRAHGVCDRVPCVPHLSDMCSACPSSPDNVYASMCGETILKTYSGTFADNIYPVQRTLQRRRWRHQPIPRLQLCQQNYSPPDWYFKVQIRDHAHRHIQRDEQWSFIGIYNGLTSYVQNPVVLPLLLAPSCPSRYRFKPLLISNQLVANYTENRVITRNLNILRLNPDFVSLLRWESDVAPSECGSVCEGGRSSRSCSSFTKYDDYMISLATSTREQQLCINEQAVALQKLQEGMARLVRLSSVAYVREHFMSDPRLYPHRYVSASADKKPLLPHIFQLANNAPWEAYLPSALRRKSSSLSLRPAPLAAADPTAPPPEPNLRVLKTIKKAGVEVLCPQHNLVCNHRLLLRQADGLRADILALLTLAHQDPRDCGRVRGTPQLRGPVGRGRRLDRQTKEYGLGGRPEALHYISSHREQHTACLNPVSGLSALSAIHLAAFECLINIFLAFVGGGPAYATGARVVWDTIQNLRTPQMIRRCYGDYRSTGDLRGPEITRKYADYFEYSGHLRGP
ncbi:hypothetical protein B0H11DRAFT_1941993 [Mycena galericulata]|nr:hypothetical protein B0H11DRAFT_1941993 [Mycena galericulata]